MDDQACWQNEPNLQRPGDVTNQTRPELFWIQLYNVRTMYMPCGLEFTLTQLYQSEFMDKSGAGAENK